MEGRGIGGIDRRFSRQGLQERIGRGLRVSVRRVGVCALAGLQAHGECPNDPVIAVAGSMGEGQLFIFLWRD